MATTLFALAAFLTLGRKLSRRIGAGAGEADIAARRRLACLGVGVATLHVLLANPFSLLFFVLLPCWLFITGRRGPGRALDILLFLAGCGWLFALVYVFGFQILRNDLAVLWYLMMMFSIQMIGFPTAVVILTVVAAGLSLVVPPARGARRGPALAARDG